MPATYESTQDKQIKENAIEHLRRRCASMRTFSTCRKLSPASARALVADPDELSGKSAAAEHLPGVPGRPGWQSLQAATSPTAAWKFATPMIFLSRPADSRRDTSPCLRCATFISPTFSPFLIFFPGDRYDCGMGEQRSLAVSGPVVSLCAAMVERNRLRRGDIWSRRGDSRPHCGNSSATPRLSDAGYATVMQNSIGALTASTPTQRQRFLARPPVGAAFQLARSADRSRVVS